MRQPQFRKGKAMETKLAKDEEIAMLRVLKKRIDERLKDIEGSEKDELIKLYDECGIDRKQVKIGDEPVGSISITMSKPKPYIDPIKKASALAYLEAKGLTEEAPPKDGRIISPRRARMSSTATRARSSVSFFGSQHALRLC